MSGFDLTDRVIVVTGARGMLGRPICEALAEAGASILGIDAAPSEGRAVVVDVRSVDSLAAVLKDMRAVWRCHAPDGLVILHGIDAPPGQDAADPWRSWDEMVSVNLTGTANACRVFGTAMAEAGRGSIVTVGSLYAGLAPDQRMYQDNWPTLEAHYGWRRTGESPEPIPVTFTKPAAYSASKSGVLGLTRYLAAYWASSGVRVNCLSPGGIGSESTPAAFRERFESRVPLGRMGTSGDLVGAVQFLLSDASAYVTGQEIRVDGGFSVL